MTTTITVCDTCRHSDGEKLRNGETGGAVFARAIEDAAAGSGLIVRRHSCLMGCERHCNVAVQAPGKLSYVLGRFEGSHEDAAALVDYAVKHAESESGVVPFREWPQGVKGHFVARLPMLD